MASLVPKRVVEVKLLLIALGPDRVAPVGHSLLFAVGAGPPHDGVRKARRPNLFHDLAGFCPQALDSQRDRLAHRPHGNDPVHPVGRNLSVCLASFQAAASKRRSWPNRNSVSSLHMRCRMTASLRATATRARAMPRALAIFMPQARRADHLRLRTRRVCAPGA